MNDVTVIIPAFGAAATLATAVDSVREQAAVIVVLDGPDADAEAVLSALGGIQVIRLPSRSGAPAARNQGLSRVETDYVMFLDADDHIEGPLVASAFAVAQAETADVVFGRFVYDWPCVERRAAEQPYLGQDMSWKGVVRCWLSGKFTPPCAVLWRADFVRALGGWDESLHKNQDGDLVYRALFENPRIAVTTKGLGVYVQHDGPGRISAQHDRVHLDSQLRVLERVRAWSGERRSPWRAELGAAYGKIAGIAEKSGLKDIHTAALAAAQTLGTGHVAPPRAPLRGVYINLDHAAVRRQEIETELLKLPAGQYERFPAVDGRELPTRPDAPNPAELGCYQSHLDVIRAHVGYDGWLHVLEDDALVSRCAAEAISLVTTDAGFARYDVIFTNVMFNVPPSMFPVLRGMFDRTVETNPDGDVAQVKTIEAVALVNADFLLATSYLVNPRAAERVADLLETHLETEPFAPVDLVFSRLSRSGALSMACVLPFLTLPRIGAPSTILSSPDPLSIPLRIAEAAFYADRDMAQLRAWLREMRETAPASATSELLADAYRQMLNTT